MEYTAVTNLSYANRSGTVISCTVNFKTLGEVPFAASQNDTEAHGVEIYTRAVNGDFGPIAAYTAPTRTTEELLATLANKRYAVETAGYTWNGYPVDSDDRAQFKAFTEMMSIQAGTRIDGALWKFQDGEFRRLRNAEFMRLFSTGKAFITKCSNTESAVIDRVVAGETDIDAIWSEEWAK